MIERPGASLSPEAGRKEEAIRRGKLLAEARIRLGWPQSQVARESKVTQPTVCDLENGDFKAPGYKTTIQLAQTLGIGINFSEGQTDERVFLISPARVINETLQNPGNPTLKATFSAYAELIPELSESSVVYIEWLPSEQKIGRRIRKLREMRGLTHRQITDKASVSQGYLSQLEIGTKGKEIENPSIQVLEKIAYGLRMDLHELLELQVVEYSPSVVRVDKFFRSNGIPVESKRKAWQVISSLRDHLTDPTFVRLP